MIISDLNCLEVLSGSDDVVGGQTVFSFSQSNTSGVSQRISSGSNSGIISNFNTTDQSNTSGDITVTVTEAPAA